MVSAISIRNLIKVFTSPYDPGGKHVAVDGVTLDVLEGELLAIVGPSGSGKSTILRLIAGLEEPTGGEIYLDGGRIDGLAPRSRDIGFMFQGYALFSRSSVAENIGFGLRMKKMPKKEHRRRVEEMVALMGLEGLESRKPDQLSSGQLQRVALARALAPRPRILLLDEPFGALDAKARRRLWADTKRWQRALRIPTVLVTGDQQEALELGDRVATLNEGRFEQVTTSQNTHNNPANQSVAYFIGKVNVFSSGLGEERGEGLEIHENHGLEIPVDPKDYSILPWDGLRPLEQEEGRSATKHQVFQGRTVSLEVNCKNGNPPSLVLPDQQASINGLTLGKPVVLPVGSFQVVPSGTNGSQKGPNGSRKGPNGSHAEPDEAENG